MQWWCSAQAGAFTWTWQPYPGVWAFVGLLAFGYWRAWRGGWEATAPGAGTGRDRRLRMAAAAGAVLMLFIALGWPLGPLGAGYLASAHMVQFLLIAQFAPPLLLLAVPPGAWRRLREHGTVVRALRALTHPLVALALFNAVMIGTHVPAVVDTLVASPLGMFALNMVWLFSGLVFWWPVVAPVPQRPKFRDIVKVGYLGAQMIANTPLFFWFTFSEFPHYATYELAPRVPGIPLTVMEDQVAAGCIMKIVGGLFLLGVVGVLFYRWAERTEHDGTGEPARARARRREPAGSA